MDQITCLTLGGVVVTCAGVRGVCGFVTEWVRSHYEYAKVCELGRLEIERERIKSARLERATEQTSKLSADANHSLKLRIDIETGTVEITPPSPAPQRKANQPSRAQLANWIS